MPEKQQKRRLLWLCLLMTWMMSTAAMAGGASLTNKKISLTQKSVHVLRVKNASGNASWKVSNKKVLGIVYKDSTRIVLRAKKKGTAKVTCKVDGKKLTCKYTVKTVKGIPKKLTLIEGDKIKFKQSSKKGTWTSSNESIARISGKRKAKSKTIRFMDIGTVKITEKIGKKRYSCTIRVLTKQGLKERPAPVETAPTPSRVTQFIQNCYEIGRVVDADIAAGVAWAYYNSSGHRSASTFEETRAQGKTWTNCMGGVTFALRLHDLVGSEGVRWFATKGGINWLTPAAQSEADARRYFDVIPVLKKVGDAIADGTIHPGDILTYRSMVHVNVYLGDMLSYDTGHAFCSGSGEGARYQRWIGPTPYQGYTCCYVLRLKEVVGAPDTPTPTPAPTPQPETETEAERNTETETGTETETNTETETGTETETNTETETGAETETETGTKPGAGTETQAGSGTDSAARSQTDPISAAAGETNAVA